MAAVIVTLVVLAVNDGNTVFALTLNVVPVTLAVAAVTATLIVLAVNDGIVTLAVQFNVVPSISICVEFDVKLLCIATLAFMSTVVVVKSISVVPDNNV